MTNSLRQPPTLAKVLHLLYERGFEAVGVAHESPGGDVCYKLNAYQANTPPDVTRKALATVLLDAGYTAFGISTVVLYNTSLMPGPQEYVEVEMWPMHQALVPESLESRVWRQSSSGSPSNN